MKFRDIVLSSIALSSGVRKLFGLAALAVGLAGCSADVVRVAFDENVADYTPVVRQILEAHPEGDIVLKFDKALYPFYPENAAEEFLNISNNDSGNKRIAFLLRDMKNVSIVGDSTDFMFHGSMVPIASLRSKNVIISGISVDYDWPWTFEGEVVSCDQEAKSFVLKVFPDNKYRIVNDKLLYGGYDWEYPMGENIVFDPETRRPVYNTLIYEYGWSQAMNARELGDGLVEFYNVPASHVPPVGSIWDSKGEMGQNRSWPAIAVLCSENVTVENVHVYRSGAMSLIAEYSKDITVKGMSTARHEGSQRMITSSADATHFVNCKGSILLEDCVFESMLDDATNIHGIYMLVDSVLTGNKVSAHFGHFQQVGNWFAEAGDRLRFVDRTSLRPVGEGTLVSIDRSDREKYVLKVKADFDLSERQAQTALAVENISCDASATIRNCTVQYNRARSFLLSTPGDVLVENCTLKSQMAGINVTGDANYWYESGPTRNVVIRGNVFEDLDIGGNGPQGVLQVDPMVPEDARDTSFYYHDNVVFEGNTVRCFDNRLINARCVRDLSIRNNKFIDSRTYEPIFPNLSAFDIHFCGNLEISGNDFSAWKPDAFLSISDCVNVTNDSALPTKE